MYKHFVFILLLVFISSCSSSKKLTTSSDFTATIEHFRSEYKADFIKDTRSPLREEDFKFMHFYKANENYKCNCLYTATPESKPFELSTYSGLTKPFKQHGLAKCEINGKEIELHFYTSPLTQAMPGYEKHLFLPFKDLTSSEETYGGGRYIDLNTDDIKNGMIEVDFNKSYNPWCAYSDGYNCPIPPVENHLDVAIAAGEKMWTGKKKK